MGWNDVPRENIGQGLQALPICGLWVPHLTSSLTTAARVRRRAGRHFDWR